MIGTEVYAGAAAPYNFNGLVRHYFLRSAPHQGDVQVSLARRQDRHRSSHAIARAARPLVDAIARPLRRAGEGGRGAARAARPRNARGRGLRPGRRGPPGGGATGPGRLLATTEGVVDVDWYVESPRQKAVFSSTARRPALAGIREADVACDAEARARTRRGGRSPAARRAGAHPARGDGRAPSCATTSRRSRRLSVAAADGRLVPLSEIGRFVEAPEETLDLPQEPQAGRLRDRRRRGPASEAPSTRSRTLEKGIARIRVPGRDIASQTRTATAPFDTARYGLKWDGEWHVTYEVFRDLGLAFAAVLVLIYVLVVGWFRSFTVPARHHGADPADARRHPAGARPLRRLLHGDLDDRLHRGRRHHRPQLDHPRGLHRAAAPRRGCRSPRRSSTRARCGSGRCC